MIGELGAQVLMHGTFTTSANGDAVDMRAMEITAGAALFVLLTTTERTYSGSPSIVFEVQESDTSTFDEPITLATFAAIETTGIVNLSAFILPTRRYLRGVATFSAAADTGDYILMLIGSRRTTLPSDDLPSFSTVDPVPLGPVPLLDLEADALILNDGDPVSTWADQSGNGRDFTQTGSARPTKQTIDGFAAVVFDGIDDWMLGAAFADNLDSATFICVVSNWNGVLATKIGNDFCSDPGSTGWSLWDESLTLLTDIDNNIGQGNNADIITPARHLFTQQMISRTELHSYTDGVLDDRFSNGGNVSGSGVSSYANSEPVRLCADGLGPGGCDSATSGNLYALRIYTPALNTTDRAAVEAELAARYGIIL